MSLDYWMALQIQHELRDLGVILPWIEVQTSWSWYQYWCQGGKP